MSITGSQLLVLALSLLVQSGGETHIKPTHIIPLKGQTFTIHVYQNTVAFVTKFSIMSITPSLKAVLT